MVVASNSFAISRAVQQQPPLALGLVLLDAGPRVGLDIRAIEPDLGVFHAGKGAVEGGEARPGCS